MSFLACDYTGDLPSEDEREWARIDARNAERRALFATSRDSILTYTASLYAEGRWNDVLSVANEWYEARDDSLRTLRMAAESAV